MEIGSFEELTQRHRALEGFGPHGFGWVLSPDQSLHWLQDIVAAYDLDDRVPEHVRGYYETARRLHVYGYFEYRFFAIADERATFAAEFAVRRRFLQWYEGLVPIERRDHDGVLVHTDTVEATDTWKFDEAFRRKHRKGWRLVGHADFNGSFGAHLDWARRTIELGRYFGKGRDRITGEERPGRLDALRDLRNMAAHPSMDMRVMPADSSRSIEFASRFINALWGMPCND